ncbi:hypothetical protein S510_003200 [Salmonella enterica subsp. arizonae]|nr:hypothetical protein [Salmonella enterica subsp. arizonae]
MPFYRQGLCKNAGPQNIAAEVESYTQYAFSLRQFAGCVSIRPEVSRFPGSSVLADHPRFLLYGLRPALPQGFVAA